MPRCVLAICAGVVAVACLWADEPPTTDEKKAEALVRDLSSPAFATRDQASRDLWKLGEAARSALETAAKSDDPEVVQRANDILEKFGWGIYADTPADVLKQIKEFRTGESERQAAAVGALLKLPDRGIKTVGLLLAHDFAPERRTELFEALLTETRERVPLLLFEAKGSQAERLLELGALGPNPEAWLDYALFMAQHGKLKEATAHLTKRAAGASAAAQSSALALAIVQHLDGNTPAAIKRLRSLPKESLPPDFVNTFLEDSGAWAELASQDEVPPDTLYAGLDLFRHRMAGNKQKAIETIASLKKAALELGDETAYEMALSLLLNERPLDAIEILREKKARPRLLADVLTDRLQFKEVLELLADGGADKPDDNENTDRHRFFYDLRKARVLAQLGRKDDSVQLFNRIAEEAPNAHSFQTREYLRAAMRSGHFDLAAEYAGKALSARNRLEDDLGPFAGPDAMEMLFDEDTDAAWGWWQALLNSSPLRDDPGGAKMRHLRALWAGNITPERLKAIQTAMEAWKKTNANPQSSIVVRTRIHRGLAAVAWKAGRLDEAEREMRDAVRAWGYDATDKLRDAADVRTQAAGMQGPRAWMYSTNESFRVWLDLGDLLVERGKPAEAAKVYADGWKQYPNNPILLYLSGRSLRATGDKSEGERRVQLAHRVALGDAQVRGRFLHELCDRGELADLRIARDWTRKCVWHHTVYRGNVWNQLSRSAYALDDFEGAANAIERNLYFLMKTPQIVFIDGAGYIRVPANVRAHRARAALAGGKAAEAFAESKDVLTLLPAHTEFLTGIVPALDKQNRTTEANELFQITWTAAQKLIRENPSSAWAYATAATAAAGCRRELDAALAYAKKAVELQPELKWHHEALAEVHFRRNDRAAAIAVMEQLRKRDPRSAYYKRLLVRYRSADIGSPVLLSPEED